MPTRRDDPYPRFNFLVDVDGVERAGFTEVLGLEGEVEVIEYREGGDSTSASRLLPGRVRYPRVVLRRGVAGDTSLFEWWNAIRDGSLDRRRVTVTLLDEARQPVARWNLPRAWPTKYVGPALNARASEVAIESLELAHEGIELE